MAWLAALGALGANIYGSVSAADAQEEANRQLLGLTEGQFNTKILLDAIGRGLPYSWSQYHPNDERFKGYPEFPSGTPVKQPYYSGTNEIEAYNRANDIFQQTNQTWGTPENMIKGYTAIANQSRPAIQSATKSLNDLFSGARTQQRLAEQAPVSQARTSMAAGQRSAVYQNLQNRLNELKAKQANSGFVGGSTFDRSAMFREAMPFYQEAANTMAAANLQNALDEQAIRNQDWNMALSNINVPYELANKNIAFEQMPALNAVSGYNQAYGIYSPFLLGSYQSPGYTQLPNIQPVMSVGGNVANAAGDFL